MVSSSPVTLRYTQHDRDSAGREYVYPVLSRRAGGISLGINLNTNNACNWACLYCQVENLQRGGPSPVNLVRLEIEFRSLLSDILAGDIFSADAPPEQRVLVDVAFSGNGEPTSAPAFPLAVAMVYRVLDEVLANRPLPVRLITNGSLLHRASARDGVAMLGRRNGEVWFKLDRALPESVRALNGVAFNRGRVLRQLIACSQLATTWIQTCWLAIDGAEPSTEDQNAYLDFLTELVGDPHSRVRGVLLYGLARASAQPAAPRLSRLSAEQLQRFADQITQKTGLEVRVSP